MPPPRPMVPLARPARHGHGKPCLLRREVSRWLCLAGLSLAVVVGVDGVALPSARAADSAPPEPAAAASRDELLQRAGEAFEAQQFALALELLQQACGQSDFEGCSFNLGAVHHALRHCAEARHHYRAYLEAYPAGARRGEAQAALDALEPICGVAPGAHPDEPATGLPPVGSAGASSDPARLAALPASPGELVPASPPERPTPPAAQASGTSRILALSLLGLGGAASVATLLLALELSSTNADIEAHRSQPFDPEQQHRLDKADQFQALTLGAGSASVLLLGSAAAVWWLAPGASPGLSVSIGPELRLRVSGQF
jgi:hypothetical protein